eukprot:403360921
MEDVDLEFNIQLERTSEMNQNPHLPEDYRNEPRKNKINDALNNTSDSGSTGVKSDGLSSDSNRNSNDIGDSLNEKKPQKFKDRLPQFIRNSSHPIICVLQFIFKLVGFLSYLLLNIFVGNLVLVYIVVIISQAVDFYVSKNITGRILVGLRWWSQINEDGTEEWIFESLPDENKNQNKADSRTFWFTTYATPILWMIFVIVSILSFSVSNVTICLFGAMLSFTNLMGYIKCEKNHKSQVGSFFFNQAKDKLTMKQMAQIGTMAAKYAPSE